MSRRTRLLVALVFAMVGCSVPGTGTDETILGPDVLADGFRPIDDSDANCGAGLDAQMALIDPADGSVVWDQPIPYIGSHREIALREGTDGPFIVAPSLGWDSQRAGGFALELRTGRPLWQRDAARGSTERVVGDVIIEQVSDDQIRALDATDGSRLWEVADATTYRAGDASLPTDLDTGLVFLSGWPTNNDVFAVDQASGTERWRRETDGEPTLFGGDDGLYVLSWPAHITRLDPGTGSPLWTYVPSVDGAYLADASVSDGRLLVAFEPEESGATEFWTLLDASTGEEISDRFFAPPSTDIMSQNFLEPRWFDGSILTLVWNGSPTSTYTSIDPATGTERWSIEVQRPAGIDVHGSILVARRRTEPALAAAGVDVYDSAGRLRWSREGIRDLTPSASTVTDGLLVVGWADDGFGVGERGAVTAFDVDTGEERWSISTDLPVSRAPITTSDGLVTVTSDLEIWCD